MGIQVIDLNFLSLNHWLKLLNRIITSLLPHENLHTRKAISSWFLLEQSPSSYPHTIPTASDIDGRTICKVCGEPLLKKRRINLFNVEKLFSCVINDQKTRLSCYTRYFFCAIDFVLNARLFAPILYLFQQTIFYLFQVLHIYTPTLIKLKYLDEEL